MRLPVISATMLVFAACATVPAKEESAVKDPSAITVMILGTWHFAGSSGDLVSAKTDSVLTPRRQQELDDVAARLAAFRPTVIVTERVTPAPDYIDPKFSEFTAADLASNENERVQIAYRLAAKAGVTRVYGLDEQPGDGEPDYFPFDKVMEHAAASGQEDSVNALIAGMQTMANTETERLETLTMSEALIKANEGDLSTSVDFYYELLKFDSGEDQPGAELNAYWFMRNAKIFSKLIDVTKPGDRVIVVFGAGHKFWLDHLADKTPGYERVDPATYLRRQP
jgi:hypothetical protein